VLSQSRLRMITLNEKVGGEKKGKKEREQRKSSDLGIPVGQSLHAEMRLFTCKEALNQGKRKTLVLLVGKYGGEV